MTSRNELAETIHKARWPAHRQMAITPFAEEDRNGREYCFRIADAVLAANAQEAWVAALLNATNPEQALAATPALDIPLHKAIERIIEDHVRDFHGLRNAVTNTSDGMISVNRETDFQVSPIKSDGETKA